MKRILLIVALLSMSLAATAPTVSADHAGEEECVGEEDIVAVCKTDRFAHQNACWLVVWAGGDETPVCLK